MDTEWRDIQAASMAEAGLYFMYAIAYLEDGRNFRAKARSMGKRHAYARSIHRAAARDARRAALHWLRMARISLTSAGIENKDLKLRP
jgi:hypothetical protein